MKNSKFAQLTEADIDRVMEMAWEDRTPFEAIETQFGLTEQDVIDLMRQQMKPSSWRMWRARVQGRATKHLAQSPVKGAIFHSRLQRTISHNKITKK